MNVTRLLAYGVPGLPLAFTALPIYVHVPRFYAESARMDLASLGVILLGARLLDAGIDPWLGWIADRMRRRVLLALALVPLGSGFFALLNPPSENAGFWLLGSLCVTYVGYSAASVAYQAWGADVGADSRSRTRLTASREGFGLVGVMLAAALPGWLAPSLNEGVARLAWVLPPLLVAAAAIALGTVGDGQPASAPSQPFLPSLRQVWADGAFRRLLGVFVANGIAAALPATLFLFFVADVLRGEAASGPLLALYFASGAISLPLWVRLAARWGRALAWLGAMGLAMAAFAWASALGAGDLRAYAIVCAASGLALGADLALPAAIAADLGERRGRAGAYFGVWNFAAKLNLALAAGLALPALAWLGYRPGSGEGLAALSFGYALLPLAFKALAAGLLWRWRDRLEL
ncbi:MAG: MFS transporter [Candidatus Competibacteraceae bacterium]|nr:MFS transporter [Candidatus Competibacteraceae bacterium]